MSSERKQDDLGLAGTIILILGICIPILFALRLGTNMERIADALERAYPPEPTDAD